MARRSAFDDDRIEFDDDGWDEDEDQDEDSGAVQLVLQKSTETFYDPKDNPAYIETTIGTSATFISIKLNPMDDPIASFFLDGKEPEMVIDTLSHYIEDGYLNSIIGFMEKYGKNIRVAEMFRLKLDAHVRDVKNAIAKG